MIRADTVRNTAQTMLDRNQRRGEIGASERMRQDDPTNRFQSVASCLSIISCSPSLAAVM
jgi:hypothetical protein